MLYNRNLKEKQAFLALWPTNEMTLFPFSTFSVNLVIVLLPFRLSLHVFQPN